VLVVSSDGRVVSRSPMARSRFGPGDEASRVLPPEILKLLDRVRAEGRACTVDVDRCSVTVSPVLWDAEGRLSGMSVVVEAPRTNSLMPRLESVFRCALDGLLVADPEGRIVLANDRAARIFAVPKEELLRPMSEYPARFKPRIPGNGAAPAVPLGLLALRGEVVEPVERVILAGDGTERYLRTGAAPLRDDGGNIEGAVIVIADVTSERRALDALRESETRFRALVEGLDAIVWEADPVSWRFTYVNRRAERILGYPVERWLEDKDFWIRILHPEDREAAARACLEAIAAARDNDLEYRVIHADGRIVWMRDLVYVGVDDAGLVRSLRGIMLDVTERKRAAEELRTVLESTPAIVWIAHDSEGRRVTGNRASYDLLRMPPGTNASITAPRGAPTHFRVYAGGRELAPEEYPVQRAARGEEIRDFEEEIVFADGRRVRLLGNAVPLRDGGGAPRGAVAAFVDVTERVRADAEVRELNQTLEARVEERTRELNAFAYTVAHDLRAPLRSMTGFSDILLEDYGDRALAGEGRGFVERIRESALRMDALIQGLLEYSRLGRVEDDLGPVDVGAAVAEAVAQNRAEIERRGAEVVARGPFPPAKGSRLPLAQALANLVSNAVKFTAKDVRPRVEIRGEKREGWTRVLVKDNGIGIAPAYHERVFGVFERLHPARDYPGTGIGLAIVRRAIERMGGRVGLSSEPGAGSEFWIELPGVSGE
jgi:PAS domain S-box-containing protein